MIDFTWLAGQDTVHLPGYLIALAIGLLVGLERERKPNAKAGLRTCALVSLTGAVAAALAETFSAPSILAVGLGAIAFMIVAAYYHHHEAFHDVDSGTTTIAAVIACYLLGALVMTGHVRVAVILSIFVTLLLHFKAELSGVARKLEQRDLVSILQFAVVAFVVLPLLPDRGYGPYAALNPRHIWSMVVLISGLSLVGYVALHLFGRQHGALLLGLFGGLVSSTATTVTYSRHARDGASSIALAFDVILTANLVLLLRLGVLALVVAPDDVVNAGTRSRRGACCGRGGARRRPQTGRWGTGTRYPPGHQPHRVASCPRFRRAVRPRARERCMAREHMG